MFKSKIAAISLCGLAALAGSGLAAQAAGASTEVSGSGASYGAIGAVRLAANCFITNPSSLRVDVSVDQSATGFRTVWIRGFYNQWRLSGTSWVRVGSGWTGWSKGYTTLMGEYTLGVPTPVASGYTYTMGAEVFLYNGNTPVAHHYYMASSGEYYLNGSSVSGTGCTPR